MLFYCSIFLFHVQYNKICACCNRSAIVCNKIKQNINFIASFILFYCIYNYTINSKVFDSVLVATFGDLFVFFINCSG